MADPGGEYSVPFIYAMQPGETVSIDYDPNLLKKPMKVRLLHCHCPDASQGKTAHLVVSWHRKEYTLLIARPAQLGKLNIPIIGMDKMTLRNIGDAEIILHGVQKIALQKSLQKKLENPGLLRQKDMPSSAKKNRTCRR